MLRNGNPLNLYHASHESAIAEASLNTDDKIIDIFAMHIHSYNGISYETPHRSTTHRLIWGVLYEARVENKYFSLFYILIAFFHITLL